jgi:hypothetical protein
MKKNLFAVFVIVAIAVLLIMVFRRPDGKTELQEAPLNPVHISNAPVALVTNLSPLHRLSKLKSRWSDFTDAEKDAFRSNFVARYKPALIKWSESFSGRVPFSPDAVTPDNLAERVGRNAAYHDYIFVVDGITLGIQDAKGVASVDYLNDPNQTGKMSKLPNGGEAPISTAPISKDDVVKMLAAEGGTQFKPNDIRLTPSGYSGSLNGGAIVNVGGNPNNAASWKYDMVFGNDGKIAYYLKPNH